MADADLKRATQILREREFQMMGAAISRRNWHELEAAYNAGRDRLDRDILPAIAALTAPKPEVREALTYLESEAHRFADMYPQGSDGRNTFGIFADKIAALSRADKPAEGVAGSDEWLKASPNFHPGDIA